MTTILVVDDSEVDRHVTGNCIQSVESKVVYATDGLDALRKIEQHFPDLVITDMQMPIMNGLQLLTNLKQDYPALPVILVTSKGSESIAADALMRGAASYVPKQSLARDLPDTIQHVLQAARDDLGHSMLMHCMDCNSSSFTIYNDLSLIKTLVSHFQEMLRCLPLGDETERLRVGIALYEALSNAYYHGNLEIGSSIERSDREAFAMLANERQLQPPYCDRKIGIEISLDRESVRCVVRDEGPGFDTSNLAVTLSAESMESGGRGIILMHTIMDEVSYNDRGNEVTLVKRKVVPAEDDESHHDDEA
jgi:CheY-like chemotaxis protein/anti-sigma regulatory factor (Ser/Thr protein kinase)